MSDTTTAGPAIEACAEFLRERFSHRTFGTIRFWRFAPRRPGDDAWELASVSVDGERMDLLLAPAGRDGAPETLSVWSPEGPALGAGGFRLAKAFRVALGDCHAWTEDGIRYILSTPRGEGSFDIAGTDALSLEY